MLKKLRTTSPHVDRGPKHTGVQCVQCYFRWVVIRNREMPWLVLLFIVELDSIAHEPLKLLHGDIITTIQALTFTSLVSTSTSTQNKAN